MAFKADLIVGTIHTNGKGTFRRVTGIGPEFTLYDSQGDRDCLRYRLIAKKSGPAIVWTQYNSTASSFRAWAKGVATIADIVADAQPASRKPRTVHSGVFIHVSEDLVYQFVGGKAGIVSHRKSDIPATIVEGSMGTVRYERGGTAAYKSRDEMREPD